MDGGNHHSIRLCLMFVCLGLAPPFATAYAHGTERSRADPSDLAPERYMHEANRFLDEVKLHQAKWKESIESLETRRRGDEVHFRKCRSRGTTAEGQRRSLEEQMRRIEADNQLIWKVKFPAVDNIRQRAERERIALEDRHFRRARGDSYTAGLRGYRDDFAEYHKRYFAEIAPFLEVYLSATNTYYESMLKKCSDLSDIELKRVLLDGYRAIAAILDKFKKESDA